MEFNLAEDPRSIFKISKHGQFVCCDVMECYAVVLVFGEMWTLSQLVGLRYFLNLCSYLLLYVNYYSLSHYR